MGSQVRGCGFTSVTTVEDTFVTTVEHLLELVFAALIATLITLKRITSVKETRIDQ